MVQFKMAVIWNFSVVWSLLIEYQNSIFLVFWRIRYLGVRYSDGYCKVCLISNVLRLIRLHSTLITVIHSFWIRLTFNNFCIVMDRYRKEVIQVSTRKHDINVQYLYDNINVFLQRDPFIVKILNLYIILSVIKIWIQYAPYKTDFVTLNKSLINYLPRCSYHLLYLC